MTLMITVTNQTNNYIYDIIGRQSSIVRPEGSTTYTYYPSGSGGKTNMLHTITHYGSITEEYLYDFYGRPTTKNETIDGILHQSLFAYNIYNDMISQTYPSGYQVNYNYDVNGFLNTIKNGNNTITLYTNNGMNGLGQNTSYTLGNGKTSNTTYYFGTPTNYTTSGIQNLSLTWNYQSGNLTSRYDAIKAKTETFTYDNLNRLLSATVTGLAAINSAYSNNGNISTKTDAGTYLYNNSKINAVTNVSNSQNKISTTTQNIAYTSFYQPLTLTEGNALLTYTYGDDDQRIKSVLKISNAVTNTRYYFGDYEKNISSGTTRHLHYISSGDRLIAIVERVGTTDTYHYTYTDHLGSILTVTNSTGTVEAEQNFDPWGRIRSHALWGYSIIVPPPVWLYRGFTGHEHLPEFVLINMNGRLYDPIVGRMLSPDNNIQMPDYSQNYNRYSYALNNPLRYTDPDGEEIVTLAAIGIGMAIGAAIYSGTHLITHNFTFKDWDWGAFAGSVVAGGVGGAIAPALAAAGIGGFYGGAITGAASGFSANLTTGIWHGDHIGSIIGSSFKGAIIGAAIGGVISGANSAIKGNRFSDGAKVEYSTYAEDIGLKHVMQEGNHNCTCATGDMAMNSQGINFDQKDVRSWMGGDPNLNPLIDKDVISKISDMSGLNVQGVRAESNYVSESLLKGRSVIMTVPGNNSVAHSVSVKSAYIKQITKVNGNMRSTIVFKIFDPAINSPYLMTTRNINMNVINIFSIWK